mmetsp:Transcript_36522/g.85287  ORF Transcript_36522/g.85287 Transcript_36522/m.85287 type:complete len:297 (-) Transcript_36522:427-1317(-)|eukprot:CAMPEP_0114162264 /NCGR_PEP_ID=MMETSP0043_2-20121206/29415_1 /TAXON_ID=464988 /ORGANISM="Hemiselmis andersenii, Strain CCMP644" /LENGTH=296 /DNA_ID=CAMNT_0001258593 /DNA_START=206 /DNA_END=1096 /DNA_ORIENTATION=-
MIPAAAPLPQGFVASQPLVGNSLTGSSPLMATSGIAIGTLATASNPSPTPSSAHSLSLETQAQILQMLRAGPPHPSPAPQPCLLTSLLHTAERQEAQIARQAASEAGGAHPRASHIGKGSAARRLSGSVSPSSAPSTRPHSTDGNSDAGAESSGEEGEGHDSGGMSLIFTRRRAGQAARVSNEPVVLNRKRVQQLFDLPLKDAAALLGISMTALKKACRKIGVERWPYRKVQTPKAPTSPPISPACGPGTPPLRDSTVLLPTAAAASSASRWVHEQAKAEPEVGESDRMAIGSLLC